MQMLHILCSNKRDNLANEDRLSQREGGGCDASGTGATSSWFY